MAFVSVDDASPDVDFDGDNETDDTVRLTRFLFDCSDDSEEDDDDWVVVAVTDSVILFDGLVGTSVIKGIVSTSSAERIVS